MKLFNDRVHNSLIYDKTYINILYNTSHIFCDFVREELMYRFFTFEI